MQRDTKPPRLDREALAEDDSSATVTRIGTVVGGGACAAIAASLPAELRMGDGGSSARALAQWLALSALVMPFAIVLVGVMRRARAGARILAGDRGTVLAACLLWWCVAEVGVLAAFGALLRAKTHHHGLAGVTFALVGLATGVLSALLAGRAGRALAAAPATAQKIALSAAAVAAFVVVILVGVRTARAEGIHTAPALVDALALAVSSAIASARPLARVRPLAVAGVPVTAIVLVLGLATLRAQPALREAIEASAPLHGWILGLLPR